MLRHNVLRRKKETLLFEGREEVRGLKDLRPEPRDSGDDSGTEATGQKKKKRNEE